MPGPKGLSGSENPRKNKNKNGPVYSNIIDEAIANAKGNIFQSPEQVGKGIRDWYYGEDGKGGGLDDELRSRQGWTTQDYIDQGKNILADSREKLKNIRAKYASRDITNKDRINKPNEYLSILSSKVEEDKDKFSGPKMFLEDFKNKLMSLKNFNF